MYEMCVCFPEYNGLCGVLLPLQEKWELQTDAQTPDYQEEAATAETDGLFA